MLTASRASTVAPDGTHLASITWRCGSGGTRILAAHGNGFCKEVFRPIAEDLADLGGSFDLTAIDQAGHGDSGPARSPFDWWDLGHDVLSVLDGASGLLALGHSLGSAALAMAELLAPGTFSRMILIEPMILPGPGALLDDVPIVQAALKRRRTFTSPEEAMENWRGKGGFAGWEERALEAYVRGGLRQATGGGWELKCDPLTEAEIYRTAQTHDAFDRLGEIRVPIHIVAGEHSDTHDPRFVARIRAQFPAATAEIVEGVGHLVPMERPRLIAERLASSLDLSLPRGPR